jgi:hypothetical protein
MSFSWAKDQINDDYEVITGSGSDRVSIGAGGVCRDSNPVATAPGNDLIAKTVI